jgi:hypothetical protein
MKALIDETYDEEEILVIAGEVAYKGFDPKKIFEKVTEMANKDSNIMKHVKRLISFGLTRGFGGGKSWETIYSKTNTGGRSALIKARDALDIKLSKPSDELTITIPRLMQAFCMVTAKLFIVLAKAGMMRTFEYTGNLPQKLRWIGSPSCMSKGAWAIFKDDYVGFSVHCSKVWNREQDIPTAMRYAVLAFETTTWPKSQRWTVPVLIVPIVDFYNEEEEILVVPKDLGKKKEEAGGSEGSGRIGDRK